MSFVACFVNETKTADGAEAGSGADVACEQRPRSCVVAGTSDDTSPRSFLNTGALYARIQRLAITRCTLQALAVHDMLVLHASK